MKKLILFLFVLILGAGLVLSFEAFRFLSSGPGSSKDTVVMEVPTGTTFRAVANRLAEQGVISDVRLFMIFARLTGQGGNLKQGEYLLNKGMTPHQVISVITSGRSIQHAVTFPEGTNIYEMAKIIESTGFFNASEFLKITRDPVLVKQLLGQDLSSLEGYLFPETYMFTKFTTTRELVRSMVTRFLKVYAEVEAQAVIQMPRHEAVILASVIEKETGAPEERPLIGSVFHNRLNKRMRLQSDPTIIYGIWEETGVYPENIRKSDITRPTRYNTYTVPRLPYGPICNPGREALLAAVKPAVSEFLFFVSRNDGTHVFTKTYEDHSSAVRNFQLNPEARKGKSWRDLNKKNR